MGIFDSKFKELIESRLIEENCYPICLETKGVPTKKNMER